jgi:hypothetical protein
MQAMSADLDRLSELMASLKVDDATQRTRVVDAISALYAKLNQARARAEQKRRTLGSAEAVAQFGAQFSLFAQAVASALDMSTTPERADEQLSRLMVQLEELEGQFGEHEQFLGDILGKREELLETFETHRQALMDERQRKAQSVLDAANRIFDGLGRRTERFTTPDELNAFFAGDALVMKLRELAERLRALKDSVKADDIESRIKAARDQAVRGLRDRSDLFEDGGNVIKLGPRHRFSVNTQPLDLTLLPRGDDMAVHLTGTDYMAPLHDPELTALRAFWQVTLESESPNLYRGEYLAGQLLDAALNGRDGLDIETLERLVGDSDALATRVREFASARYRDGYEKGIHDHDATLILRAVVPLYRPAGPLVHAADARALAVAFWRHAQATPEAGWLERIRNAKAVRSHLQDATATSALATELAEAIAQFRVQQTLPLAEGLQAEAAAFLIAAITADSDQLPFTRYAASLLDALHAQLAASGSKALFNQALERLQDRPGAQWSLLLQWLQALAARPEHAALAAYAHEAAALHLHGPQLPHRIGFVRNRLIDEVYLPLIGDNLAKQIGAAGEASARPMGLLLLISPPGYGKTTLMEYVADRLGLVFVRINGPALGHEVHRIDPATAPNSAARQELEKLNLGAGHGQQRDAVRRRHPAHAPRVPAEVHLAGRRHPPHRRRVAGRARAPTTCAASALPWSWPATRTPNRAKPSASPTCWPTAPTSTTWATCSRAARRRSALYIENSLTANPSPCRWPRANRRRATAGAHGAGRAGLANALRTPTAAPSWTRSKTCCSA